MLVLTRRLNEALWIGGDVTVRVLEIGAGFVRLGISAPRAVPVHREEIFLEIQEANRLAAASSHEAVARAERHFSPNGAGPIAETGPPTGASGADRPG